VWTCGFSWHWIGFDWLGATACPIPTKRLTVTPMHLTVAVDFTRINKYPIGTRVIMACQLLLPGGMHCDDDCGVFLRNSNKYAE